MGGRFCPVIGAANLLNLLSFVRVKIIVVFRCGSISSTYPWQSVGGWVKLSDFQSVGVSGPLQSVREPWDVIYFLKYDQQLSENWGRGFGNNLVEKTVSKLIFLNGPIQQENWSEKNLDTNK